MTNTMKRTNGRINIEPLIDYLQSRREEVEQAEMGNDENGNPISGYMVRFIDALAAKYNLVLSFKPEQE